MGELRISAVAVIDESRRLVRGTDGLPGDTKKDRKRLQELMKGRAVIMGKKTYEKAFLALGEHGLRKLGRVVVLTKKGSLFAPGCIVARSLAQAALTLRQRGIKEGVVVGGRSVYDQVLGQEYVSRLYLSVVNGGTVGDGAFPEYKKSFPKEVKKKKWKHSTFFVLEK